MSRIAHRSERTLPSPALERGLNAWAAIGTLGLLLIPPGIWHNTYFGWLPYWLLVAPCISLVLLHRQSIAAALSAFLVRGRRRRKPSMRRQARRRPVAAQRRPRIPMAGGALIEG
jgi:hypothetical protein